MTRRRRLYVEMRGGYWRAVQYYQDGDRLRRRTFALHDIEGRPLKGAKARRRAVVEMRRLEIELATERSGQTGYQSTVEELADEYLAARRGRVKDSSLAVYRGVLARFLPAYGAREASSITQREAEAWMSATAARVRPATANGYADALSAFFSWAAERGAIPSNPFGRLRPIRVPERERRWMSWDEFERCVVPLCCTVDDRRAFAVAIYAGLRVGEIVHLRWSDIDAETWILTVRSDEAHETKSGRSRRVPVLAGLRPHLSGDRNGEYVAGGMRPRRENDVRDRWREICAEAGLRLRLHDLRGSFTSIALQQLSPAVVAALAGHRDVDTTMRHYNHLTVSDAVRAAQNAFG